MASAISRTPEVLDRFTRKEAAEYIGVKAQTLGLWAISGKYGLPFVKVGRKVYYRRDDLDAWLRSRTVTHTGQLDG